jgi:ACS family hexuronate transporter-like MFS transporter
MLLPKAPAELREITAEPHPWRAALGRSYTRLLLLARLMTDPVWYFYLFWFPKYRSDSHGMSLAALGRTAWVVYLAADLGALAAGYFSSLLIGRGNIPARARVRLMTVSALFLLSVHSWSSHRPRGQPC